MAGEQVQAFIDKGRQAGLNDVQIFNKMQDTPQFVQSIRKANQAGHTNRQVAAGLGLRISNEPVDLPTMKRESMLKHAKAESKTQAWQSGLLGFSDLAAGARQGFGYAADGINKGINKVTGLNLDTGDYERFTKERKEFEDWHNLRREANDQGFDWMRLGGQVAGTGPMAGAGRTYQGAKVLSKAGAEVAAQNAAVGAAIGGASFADNAEQRLTNTAFGAVGGAAGAAAGEKLGQGVVKGAQALKSQASKFSTTQTNQILASIDQKLDDALRMSSAGSASSGKTITLSDLSDGVKNSLREDAKKILLSGGDLSPEAVARKVVLDRLGLKGTQAQLTGDAKLWQKQAELSKLNGPGDPLRDKLIDDNVQLKNLLDDVTIKTGGKASDQYSAMSGALGAVESKLAQNKSAVNAAYDAAKSASGNDVALGGVEFVDAVNAALKDNYATMSLPASVRSILKSIKKKPEEFTLGKSEELIKRLNQEHQASLKIDGTGSSETYAIGLVRDVLNEQQQAMIAAGRNDAASACSAARQMHKLNVEQIESMPLLQDAVKGVEPDKLFSKHVLGGNVAELDRTIKLLNDVSPQAVNDIKQQVLEHISSKAINQSGQFSPAGMKRALDSIGTRRIKTMFSDAEVTHIEDIGKAGHYLVTQPAHSYVNNSNTASALMNHLGGLVDKPGVRMLLAPVKDIKDSVQVGKAMKSDMPAAKAELKSTPSDDGGLSLIDRLVKAGLIGGSNLPNQ